MVNMNIYQLINDFSYKSFKTIGGTSKFITFKGQSLIDSWEELEGEVYKNFDNKGKKDGFDARVHGAFLVMEKEKAMLFAQKIKVQAELLPYKIINVKRNFVFINIQNIVKGINNEGVNHLKRMELYRNKDLYFYEEASKNIIFRDATSETKLFCTQELENILNELDIKGLALEKVGKVAPIPSFSKEKNIFNR
ncbi:hypothetical protein HMPREF9075_02694 [Capnocytophaga sp. oral taxon 332 str. F0381]|nr:hypothetical protein HMPREF9075_02694 [Capnocytophaga sp. oral taxon 332 str. F0381]